MFLYFRYSEQYMYNVCLASITETKINNIWNLDDTVYVPIRKIGEKQQQKLNFLILILKA